MSALNFDIPDAIVFDYHDEVARRHADREVKEGKLASREEKALIEKLRLPGAFRQNMPVVPSKSSELRAMERSQVVPFTVDKMAMEV